MKKEIKEPVVKMQDVAEMHRVSLCKLLDEFCSEASPYTYANPILYLLGEFIGSEEFDTDDHHIDFRKNLMCEVNRTIMYLLNIHHQYLTYQTVLKLAMEELVHEHQKESSDKETPKPVKAFDMSTSL